MINGLYLITDDSRDGNLVPRVREALRGGVRVLQYRDKNLPPAEQIATARTLRGLCRETGAVFLVNDSPVIARESEADGVHLGQGDMSVAEARAILGPGRIIGVSTRTPDQARQAEADGADYIGFGSIFPTTSKGDAQRVGLAALQEVRRAVDIPVVAIGGIDSRRAAPVIDAGADAAAVISAVMSDPDPALAAREISLLFNRRNPWPRGKVLTIAGSDSGGGAGIQADLKTIALLGGYGMSAITALTAQNTLGVHGIFPVAAEFVAQQAEAVLSDMGADAAKTGMLYGIGTIAATAALIRRHALLTVVDPVMIAKGGEALLLPEAVERFKTDLLPAAYLLTPNLPEAESLAGFHVRTEGAMERAALRLRQMGARNVLIKGGHLPGDAIDLLLAGSTLHRFPSPRIATRNTHGTGCTFSAAIATLLAQGLPLVEAVAAAKDFINEAIRSAVDIGAGHGPVNHWQAGKIRTKVKG